MHSVRVLMTLLEQIGSIQEDISHVQREYNYMDEPMLLQGLRALGK